MEKRENKLVPFNAPQKDEQNAMEKNDIKTELS